MRSEKGQRGDDSVPGVSGGESHRADEAFVLARPPLPVASRCRAGAVPLFFRSYCSLYFCSIFNFCSELRASVRKYALDDALEGPKPRLNAERTRVKTGKLAVNSMFGVTDAGEECIL